MGGEGVVVELGLFDKDYLKNTRKNSQAEKYLGAFPPRYF